MKIVKGLLILLLGLSLCAGRAVAEEPATVSELRRQAASGWDKCEVLIPDVEKVPVFTLRTNAQEEPLVLEAGVFDEAQSGKFVASVRYGKTPPYTALRNGLTLEEAQSVLDRELNSHTGKGVEAYGLIWTEIARWQNMETWLLYYGQKFFGLTAFNFSTLTMDARAPECYYMIVPLCEVGEIVWEDAPLASWATVKAAVEAYLLSREGGTPETLELGYLMLEDDLEVWMLPVWRLGLQTSGGFEEAYFSAQTGAEARWKGDGYMLPEPFGWEALR